MPLKATNRKATAKKQGKSFSDLAGELVIEVIKKVRRGVREARIAKKAIAIGISEARRAAGDLQAQPKGMLPEKARNSAGSTVKRSKSISGQVKVPVKKSTAARRPASAKKAVRTKGVVDRSGSLKKDRSKS